MYIGQHQNISAENDLSRSDKVVYVRSELDSYADTIVTEDNCCIFQHTGKYRDVSPYRDDYEAIKGVPIVHAELLGSQNRQVKLIFWFCMNHCEWVTY